MLSPIDRQLQKIRLNRFIKKHVAHVKRNTKQRQRYHANKRAILEKKLLEKEQEAYRIERNNISIITETIDPEPEEVQEDQSPSEEILVENLKFFTRVENLTEDDFCDATPEKPRANPYSYHNSHKFQNFFLDIMEELGLEYEHLPF
jgi:hypothetical protein